MAAAERIPRTGEDFAANALLQVINAVIDQRFAEIVDARIDARIEELGLAALPDALEMRKRWGRQPGELAEAAGVSVTTLRMIEMGQIKNPKREVLGKISNALGEDHKRYREAVARSYASAQRRKGGP